MVATRLTGETRETMAMVKVTNSRGTVTPSLAHPGLTTVGTAHCQSRRHTHTHTHTGTGTTVHSTPTTSHRTMTRFATALALVCVAYTCTTVAAGRSLGDVNWAGLTAATLSALTPADIAGATAGDFTLLPDSACAGWTATLFAQVGANGSGLQAGCISNIPPSAIASMTAAAATSFALGQTSALTADQFAALPPTAFSQLANLNGLTTQCAGFTQAQLAAGTHYDDCSVLSGECLASMTPDAYAGLRTQCVASISKYCGSVPAAGWAAVPAASFTGMDRFCTGNFVAASFSKIMSNQLEQLTPNAIGGFNSEAFGGINPGACAGFTTPQMGSLGDYQCPGMSVHCFTSLPAIPGMSYSCINSMPTAVFAAVRAAQIAAFGSTGMNGITKDEMNTLGDQCTGFTADVVKSFTGSTAASCAGIGKTCLLNIPTTSMSSIDPACVAAIPVSVVSSFSLSQLSDMSTTNIAGFTISQLLALYDNYERLLIRAWSWSQQAALNTNAMNGWNQAVINKLIAADDTWPTDTDLTLLGPLDLSVCTTQCMKILFANTESPNQLQHVSWSGIQPTHVAVLTDTNISWLTDITSWGLFSSFGLGALTSSQVSSIVSNAFEDLNPGNLSPSGIPGMTTSQIKMVFPDVWSQFPCSNFVAFTKDQLQTLQESYAHYDALATRCNGWEPSSSTGGGASSTGAESYSSSSGTADPDHGNSGLSNGGKIGVGVGVSVGCIAIIALLYVCCCRKKNTFSSMNGDTLLNNEV